MKISKRNEISEDNDGMVTFPWSGPMFPCADFRLGEHPLSPNTHYPLFQNQGAEFWGWNSRVKCHVKGPKNMKYFAHNAPMFV